MQPYYQTPDERVTLYHGDMREVVPAIAIKADVVIADPPYAQTSLAWDIWPSEWLDTAIEALSACGSMWCFGTLRMFMERAEEFVSAGWHLAQDVAGADVDVIWEKHNGSGFHNDRFRRIHEQVGHFYPKSSAWSDIHTKPQFTLNAAKRSVRRKQCPAHWHGTIKPSVYTSQDGGPRLMPSVLQVRSMHGRAKNETEKPVDLIAPLLRYSCPSGGLVLDPFSGAGPVLEVAMRTGCRAVGVEMRQEQCLIAAERLEEIIAQPTLFE